MTLETNRPTFGLTKKERLELYRKNLIASLPALVTRRVGEKAEPRERAPDKSAKRAIARVVAEIRRVSSEIGPVRPVISNIRTHD